MRTRITFDKIARTFVKTVRCSACRGPVRRQRSFYQTLNPFNVHALTRKPKDREQIERELLETGAAWQREPELCSACEEAAEDIGSTEGA
jgi:hypothetical protein